MKEETGKLSQKGSGEEWESGEKDET